MCPATNRGRGGQTSSCAGERSHSFQRRQTCRSVSYGHRKQMFYSEGIPYPAQKDKQVCFPVLTFSLQRYAKKHLLFPKEPYPISSLWSGFIPSSSGYEFRIHLRGFFADNLILFKGHARHYIGERLISHGILVNVTAEIGHKSRHEVLRILYICSGDY
jgi:hypothetical protein